jgi:hypothetical protein
VTATVKSGCSLAMSSVGCASNLKKAAGLSGGVFLGSPRDLDACAVAFTRLLASALSAEGSMRLLCRMAGR